MVTLFFCILCSTGVLILFKLLPKLGANTSHTILLSYAVSALLGTFILPIVLIGLSPIWIAVAAAEGFAFYAVFHLMARSAKTSGVAFTSVASKMSVVIPITIGLAFLGDDGNVYVYSGVLLGLLAVLLSVGNNLKAASWRWPLLVFLGSGAIDASFKLFQVWGLAEIHFPAFITAIFAFAFVTAVFRFVIKEREPVAMQSALAGIGLGLLNLGTVYFLMQALAIASLDSTVVYSLNSFGIVLMSMLVAIGVFKEHLSTKGYMGIVMAIASIGCLYLSHTH